MTDKILVINRSPVEARVAMVEDGAVVSLQIERDRDLGMVGNIYKGRVSRVLPGMQSAFVDIGVERTGFLYGGDVADPAYLERKKNDFALANAGLERSADAEEIPRTPIEKLLSDGQEIVVQVTKDPLGTKGARLSTFLSLPGRYIVLMPEFEHVAVSRRIEDQEIRDNLIAVIESIRPEKFGVIIRTAAVGASKEELQKDINYLVKVWHSVNAKSTRSTPPALLYSEPSVSLRATRDWVDDNVSQIHVDDKATFHELERFLKLSIPTAASKIKHYTEREPIFDHFGLEVDIARALSKKVWLPSGGYVIIDQTEALISFDVNTGKFVGKNSAQETILKTNLEAARVIARQLRVRNLGGIIIIDFIDMEPEEHREQVENLFDEELRDDRAKTTILKMSELGLIQMTRKRTSESIGRKLMDECPLCDGIGSIRSPETELFDLIRDIERYATRGEKDFFTVRARPDLIAALEGEGKALLKYVVKKHKIKIKLIPTTFDISSVKTPPYEVLDAD